MDIKELQQLGDTIREYYEIKNNITADRFKWIAMAQGESNENAELLYCVFNELKDGLFALSNQSRYNPADRRLGYAKKLTKALEIAKQTYQLCGSGKKYSGDIPNINRDVYEQDRRRYFIRRAGEVLTLDVNLTNSTDIICLARLLESLDPEKHYDDGVIDLTHYIDKIRTDNGKEIPYYEGDIFFLHLNPYDSLFDIWHTDDCGVFLATDRGFVKLLYTQGRGYIDKDGRPNIDEQHHYSDYMLNGSSKVFDIVGNIHKDKSVLVDKPQTEEERG